MAVVPRQTACLPEFRFPTLSVLEFALREGDGEERAEFGCLELPFVAFFQQCCLLLLACWQMGCRPAGAIEIYLYGAHISIILGEGKMTSKRCAKYTLNAAL